MDTSDLVDDTLDDESVLAVADQLRVSDPSAAKSWLITATNLFPHSFNVHFQAYKWAKSENNVQRAAKAFSYIIKNFPQHQSEDLWGELNCFTNAIRASETEWPRKYEFYVRMFEHMETEVQQKILLLTVDHTDNSLSQIKLLFLILHRFAHASYTQAETLMEMLADGMATNPVLYQKMIVEEALPLLDRLTPQLSPPLVCRIFAITIEYHVRRIVEDERKSTTRDIWRSIFDVLTLCARILNWERFLPFNDQLGYNVYWDKLIDIMSVSPAGSTSVLFYATTLFIYTLHCYIKHCNTLHEDVEVNHILVEGFADWCGTDVHEQAVAAQNPPQISLTTNISKEISRAFVHAAQCWQLLNTEQFQRDFSKLLLKLPLASWISRFLFDLAIYFGHREEAKKLMTEMSVKSVLVLNLQMLSLNLLQGPLTPQGFECIIKIASELPPITGQPLRHLTLKVPRHMIFIPLTQRALVQYCARAIIERLAHKLYMPNCSHRTLGNLLILLQIEYPRETLMAEQIFALIVSRRSFYFRKLYTYLVAIDFIEELMYITNTVDNFVTDFAAPAARYSGVSRGEKEFRMALRAQVARANDNVTTVVANFIIQEQQQLMEDLFRNVGDDEDHEMQCLDGVPVVSEMPLHAIPPGTIMMPELQANGEMLVAPATVGMAVPVITSNLPHNLSGLPVGVIQAAPMADLASEVSPMLQALPVMTVASPDNAADVNFI